MTEQSPYRYLVGWAVFLMGLSLINRTRTGHTILYYMLVLMIFFTFVTQYKFIAQVLQPISEPLPEGDEASSADVLRPSGATPMPTGRPARGTVWLYTGTGYSGARYIWTGDLEDTRQLRESRGYALGDKLGSMRLAAGQSAILYEDTRYRGKSVQITNEVPDMRALAVSAGLAKPSVNGFSSFRLGG